VVEYSLQCILIEVKGAAEEKLLNFFDVQETILVCIELNYKFTKRS
jgi:hypothetical protein